MFWDLVVVCCYCNFFIVLLNDYLFINHLDVRVIRGLAIINFYFILYDWLFITFLCVTVCMCVCMSYHIMAVYPFIPSCVYLFVCVWRMRLQFLFFFVCLLIFLFYSILPFRHSLLSTSFPPLIHFFFLFFRQLKIYIYISRWLFSTLLW